MKSVLIFLFSVFILATSISKLDKFSVHDAVNALELMDTIDKTTNNTIRLALKLTFEDLTGTIFNEGMRPQFYQIIDKNMEHTSYFSKMLGLMSFQNILLVCMIIVGIAFLFSFVSDILFFLGAYVAYTFYKLFLTKKSLYIQGLIISFVTMYFRVDQIENKFLRYLFIFDRLTPLFGCLLFYFVVTFMYADYLGQYNKFVQRIGSDAFGKDILVNMVWVVIAIYQHNWMIATLCVIMFFNTFGFTFGSTIFGYYSGFKNDNAPQRCILISLLLNTFMLMIKTGYLTGIATYHMSIFETGIYFWASFVGAIALLIMTDEYYLQYRYCNEYKPSLFFVIQALMGFYCIIMMYIGNILYITSYQGIGGTFFVLWLLDMERRFLMKFKRGSVSILLLIILANLYIVKQLISWYPEYFIF
jgi:hypothetical protein